MAGTSNVSLGEGMTPLIRSRSIGPKAGLTNLYFKLEMLNPTGSYKDRFAASAVSAMQAAGQTRCVATSSGNTGASLAAYCAVAGIDCEIALVETAPLGKLSQMMAYGAKIFRVRGFGLDPDVTTRVFDRLDQLAARPDTALQVSAFKYSPLGMAGVRSISHELHDQLSELGHVFCPTGGGGLAMATAQGFLELVDQGIRRRPAQVHIVQPKGNDTMASALREGRRKANEVQCTTHISGLQVASITDGHEAIPACRATHGLGILVDDEATWRAQRDLARFEGVYCEPAAAISLAAALQATAAGDLSPTVPLVCLITGAAFKDPAAIERMVAHRKCPMINAEQIGV